jgi:hypothetical protein
MKKNLLLLVTIFSLLLGNLFSQTVYVTKTGQKYHADGCRYLSRSKFAIDLTDACKKYTACSVCNPPSCSNQQNINVPQKSNSNSSQTNSPATTTQCTATTKAGARCKRMTKSPNGLCWQHGGN